jgi:hypothetical protein
MIGLDILERIIIFVPARIWTADRSTRSLVTTATGLQQIKDIFILIQFETGIQVWRVSVGINQISKCCWAGSFKLV